MEDRLSRDRVDGASARRWGGGAGEAARCVLSFGDFLGGLPRLLAAPAGADLGGHGPALGDDRGGLRGGDGAAVGIADDVGGAAALTVQARSARLAATTHSAPRWSLPRSVICR